MDPRLYQIGFLFSLLLFGVWARDFHVGLAELSVVMGCGLLVQTLGIWVRKLPLSSLRSALISCLSLLLLLRTNSLWILALATVATLSSKFFLRWKAKHFFNPTNFGLVLFLLLTDQVWVSPGQWGQNIIFIYWILSLGFIVARRAERDDVSVSFLAAFLILSLARVLYLGQPIPVFFHQLKSGSLLLFTFFMISDPKTTPDHRVGRIVFGCAVALLAYYIRFTFYNPNALLYALFFLSPTTIILDNLWKSARFEWPTSRRTMSGVFHAKTLVRHSH